MCTDHECKQRSTCYRYLAHPSYIKTEDGEFEERQCWFPESPRPDNARKKCPKFWDVTIANGKGHPPGTIRSVEWADRLNRESA